MKTYKKKILIDLDGVLNEYGKEPYDENYIPEIKEGAKSFIKEMSKIGKKFLSYWILKFSIYNKITHTS